MRLPPPRPASCYDCGSTLPRRHTVLCDLAGSAKRDLPAVPLTQWWTGEDKSLNRKERLAVWRELRQKQKARR